MKGVVARFRHGPKAGDAISEEGLEVLKAQGREFARWMLSQKADNAALKKRGVDFQGVYSGVPRAGTSLEQFQDGFIEVMRGHNVEVTASVPDTSSNLRERQNVDKTAWAAAFEKAGKREQRFLRMVHRSPKLIPGESPAEQGARIETWAAGKVAEVARSKGAVKVVIGFSHEPVMGSARGVAHPKVHRAKYLVTPGRRPITTPGGLITHVSDEGIATLHEMHHAGNRKHEINYVGHI